ncbi:MAG: M48 family metallopeptidase [Nostoc sp. DedSLP01]
MSALKSLVVHELAHLLHRNHGNEFWVTLSCVMPDWRVRVWLGIG